jgi:hypothetical protein
MIYTRWGNEIEIVEKCGKHRQPGEVKGFPPVMLVKVKYQEGDFGYQFAESLRADGGNNEIETAINEAAKVSLSREKLSREAS